MKFPFDIQPDPADSAVTCIKLIASYYGKDHSLEEVRELFSDLKASGLRDIKKGAEALCFDAEPYKLSLGALRNHRLPCIAFWNGSYYVVIWKIKNELVCVSDPLRGYEEYKLDYFLKNWVMDYNEGIIVTMEPGQAFDKLIPGKEGKAFAGFRYRLRQILLYRRFL
jgi:ATP-binding cassette subfamily B protein